MIARRFALPLLVSLCAMGGGLVYGAGSAVAVVSQFGSYGEGAGQFLDGKGIAVNQASGNVYLLDEQNDRVDEFTGEGSFVIAWGEGVADGVTRAPQTCTTTCFRGISDHGNSTEAFSEAGSGELGIEPSGVAVDNDPLSPSYQDVYIPEGRNHRVEKFSSSGSFISMFGKEVNENGSDVCVAGEKCRAGKEGNGNAEFNTMEGAIAVGPTGNVFVGDRERVQEFSPEGVFMASSAVGSGYTRSLAVDGAGDFYVVSTGPASLSEYDASGTLLRRLDAEGEPDAVTLDGSGDVFVEEGLNQVHRMLEYGYGGEQVASFDAGMHYNGGSGIAFSESIDRIYLIENNSNTDVRLLASPVAGPELVSDGSVSGIEPTSAILNATINPENNATSYRFEYGLSTSYGSSAPIPEGSLVASFNEEPVGATLTKLRAGTTYHYRVVASDSKGHVTTGPDETFTTQPAVLMDEVSVTNVAATSTTFEARLNPLGVDASYRIEYDTSEYVPGGPSHGAVAIEGSLGSGSSDVPVSVHVDGLRPGTIYYYRVVASDTREGIAYTLDSPRTFTTQAAGGAGSGLLDGRRWEMVSPPDKLGAQILAIGQYGHEGAVMEAAAGGGAITYMTVSPTEADPEGYTNFMQVFSARGSSGWVSRDMGIPHESATKASVGQGEEYRFFSEDLKRSLFQPFGRFSSSLSSEASEQTPFIHSDFANGDPVVACTEDCFRPLVTGASGYANVPSGTEFGEDGKCEGSSPLLVCGPEFIDATPDLRHAMFESKASLTSVPTHGIPSLYEWSEGRLALVSVLPDGEPAVPVSPNDSSISTRNMISGDGSRVVWESSEPQRHLYVRDVASGESVQLDAVQGGSGLGQNSANSSLFQIASSDGSRVLFTDIQRLTADARQLAAGADLYECEMVEINGEPECRLSDLTPAGSEEPEGSVEGVVGASGDGSWVYFVSGTRLHVYHGGASKLIAVLSSVDSPDWHAAVLDGMTARVSSDGRWLAFMSQRELAGYDVHDAVTDEPDEEVYLYDAQANGGAGRVICASCDPTGARPNGLSPSGNSLVDGSGVWRQRIAANIPGWIPVNLISSLYQSRYLADSGRLFFNSSDGLVPQDVNGAEDVYEYEPVGVGDCTTSSPVYSVRSDGCADLISSGGSGEESAFMDASASGGDVFFLTAARLSGADRDSALDIYDAHECTGSSPCFPEPAVLPPGCDTGDGCKPAPAPQPTVFGAPSSATFSGAGNVVLSASKPVVRSKGLTRAQKRARALRECRKKKGRQRRAVCVRHARARFAKSGVSLRVTASGKGGR